MLRVVLDTNVLVSSLLVRVGLSAQVLDAWRAGRYDLVISPAIIAEMRATLGYPRIRRKYPVTDEDVERISDLLERNALVMAGVADVSNSIPADPADEKILACAVDGKADVIVSGDPQQMGVGTFRGIEILSVRAFLSLLAAEIAG